MIVAMTRQGTLFRQEAVDFQRHYRQWGDVAALEPLSIKITVWFLAVAVLLLIIFLSLAQYARKETAIGYLTPTKGTAKIFVPRRGTIREVHVVDGMAVEEGQPLLTIETDQIAADGVDINASQLETLRNQQELLTRNIRGEEERAKPEASAMRLC